MIICPYCQASETGYEGEHIKIVDENGSASIFGRANADASCHCLECGCIFTVSLEGDFDSDDYDYTVEVEGEEDV